MLKRCSGYPTITSLSQQMVCEGEVCNSEHGSDLALKEERNLSFILIISDFILFLKDACGKQTQGLKSWLWWGREETGKQTPGTAKVSGISG